MKILSGNSINREEWSRLVQTSPTGTWFQTPEAFDFFASMPDLFRPFVVAISNDTSLSEAQHSITPSLQTLRAVCVGYITKERFALKQFFTRRAIIVGGPCLADDATDDEVIALMTAVKEELKDDAIYVECRNFNSYEKWKNAFAKAGFDYVQHLNFHVDTSSMEIVEANLGKSRKRDIKTTIREGVSVVEHPTDKQVCAYYKVLEHLYRTKVKTPLFPLSFFIALNKHKDGRLLLMEYQGRIIGGTVCVEFRKFNSSIINQQSAINTDGVVYEWFACGRDGEWKSIYPSTLATYAGMRYAAEHGCSRFDMMGAGKPGEAYGVRDFKAKFGGKEVEYGRFICIKHPLLYRIGEFGVKVLRHFKF